MLFGTCQYLLVLTQATPAGEELALRFAAPLLQGCKPMGVSFPCDQEPAATSPDRAWAKCFALKVLMCYQRWRWAGKDCEEQGLRKVVGGQWCLTMDQQWHLHAKRLGRRGLRKGQDYVGCAARCQLGIRAQQTTWERKNHSSSIRQAHRVI